MHQKISFSSIFKRNIRSFKKKIMLLLVIASHPLFSDNFNFNTFNNHGVIGLINMPTARFHEESSFGFTLYDGTPDQKITMTSFPFDWMEASFFYMNIENRRLCRSDKFGNKFCQGYKDKGFNLKLRVKEEGFFPAIAVGVNDIAGTGFYSGEYIVGSYGTDNIDFHFGLGWGSLNGSKNKIKNPFGYLDKQFFNRPSNFEGLGGEFQPSRYFSDENTSFFYGVSYVLNNNLIIKYEKDTTLTPGLIGYEDSKNEFSIGLDYSPNENFTFGITRERDNYVSFKFTYKNNPKTSKKPYRYEPSNEISNADSQYEKLIKNLEHNGIGVNKIVETSSSIGIELTQFTHPNLNLVEEIIKSAKRDSGISKELKKDLKIANLKAISEIEDLNENQKIIYQKKKESNINTNNSIKFRPFIASRESFFKGAFMLENDTEIIIKDNFLFNSNIKYSLWDNFDDLTLPPVDTFPAQVRSDVKEYLRNIDNGLLIGRAQFDFFKTIKNKHHLMISAGILEDMYSGIGFEYLSYQNNKNYAMGFEVFSVYKRDYEWGLGRLGYKNITGSVNFYYRNYGLIPFDAKLSIGEYIAGDVGTTIELSRSFKNGTEFGVFASFTDVSAEQYGEGSFDKGIFFNIPIYGNFINYSWRPLTKDPGAKLVRKNNLYDLLVRFSPIN